jgi:hypothetical protein
LQTISWNTRLDELGLSTRTAKCLENMLLPDPTVRGLAHVSEKEMMGIPNFGKVSLEELKIVLSGYWPNVDPGNHVAQSDDAVTWARSKILELQEAQDRIARLKKELYLRDVLLASVGLSVPKVARSDQRYLKYWLRNIAIVADRLDGRTYKDVTNGLSLPVSRTRAHQICARQARVLRRIFTTSMIGIDHNIQQGRRTPQTGV